MACGLRIASTQGHWETNAQGQTNPYETGFDMTLVAYIVPTVLQLSTISHPIAISVGAIAGALSRYYLHLWFAQRCGTSFPYGTFAINLSGCLGMGFFTTLILERAIAHPELQPLIAVGFLGSYTTFSTYALDTANLLRTGNQTATLFYWAGSGILGVLCLELGSLLARSLI